MTIGRTLIGVLTSIDDTTAFQLQLKECDGKHECGEREDGWGRSRNGAGASSGASGGKNGARAFSGSSGGKNGARAFSGANGGRDGAGASPSASGG